VFRALEATEQNANSVSAAVSDFSRALARKELLKNKDKEVRLYIAACFVQVMRLHAPDSPYTEQQLKEFFRYVLLAFQELSDPDVPYFHLCMSILLAAAQVKCCVLALDLGDQDLLNSMYAALLDSVNQNNADRIQGPVQDIMCPLIEEGDEVSQPLLDALLSHLSPASRSYSPAGYTLAQSILRRTQQTIQPSLQKFLSCALEGRRTESELREDPHALILYIYETIPQVLLPVLPHVVPELHHESEERRLRAVDLLGRLFTASPSRSGRLLIEYAALLEELLGRLQDRTVEVRMRVLSHIPYLADACPNFDLTVKVLQAVALRTMDMDDRVRGAATRAFASMTATRPWLIQDRRSLEPLLQRLRDKKVAVRREAASSLAQLLRTWSLKSEDGGPSASENDDEDELVEDGDIPKDKRRNNTKKGKTNSGGDANGDDDEDNEDATKQQQQQPQQQQLPPGTSTSRPNPALISYLASKLLITATTDKEVGSHLMGVIFRNGIFPRKLSVTVAAQYWELMWADSSNIIIGGGGHQGSGGRKAALALMKQKIELQRKVQYLLRLRTVIKEQRASVGNNNSAPTAADGGKDNNKKKKTTTSDGNGVDKNEGDGPRQLTSEEAATLLTKALSSIAPMLKDVDRAAAEGLQRLWNMKDNYIFYALTTLATFGTSARDAAEAAKELTQRVGNKGCAAEVARSLAARLSPTVLSPEVLRAVISHAGESEAAQTLLSDIATHAAPLFAQSLDAILTLFDEDDALLAESGARLLGSAGRHIIAYKRASLAENSGAGDVEKKNKKNSNNNNNKKNINDSTTQLISPKVQKALREMCFGNNVARVKAAVVALVVAAGPTEASPIMNDICSELMESMRDNAATLQDPRRLLAHMKVMSMVGRLLPILFADWVEEFADFVLNILLPSDRLPAIGIGGNTGAGPAHGNKLGVDVQSPLGVKCAALKTLAQSLVPESPDVRPPETTARVAALTIKKLCDLTDEDPGAVALRPFAIEWPSEDEEDEMGEEESEASIEAAWVRCCAMAALFRLARSHDSAMDAKDYVTMANGCQDQNPEVRKIVVKKLSKLIHYYLKKKKQTSPQRTAKYAALLALSGVDGQEGVQRAAYTTLSYYINNRRAAVMAAAKAAQDTTTGGANGATTNAASAAGKDKTMINDMPEFLLTFLVFILAHHDDYTEDMYTDPPQPGDNIDAHRLSCFQRMLQFALEPLILPPSDHTNPDKIAKLMPASMKLLRQLKHCDACSVVDREIDEVATVHARQICDMGLALVKAISDKLTKDNTRKPERFPGAVSLPRMCFKPKELKKGLEAEKHYDGSDLPAGHFLWLNHHFFAALYGGVTGLPVVRRVPTTTNRGGKKAATAKQIKNNNNDSMDDDEDGDIDMALADSEDDVEVEQGPARHKKHHHHLQQQQIKKEGKKRAAAAGAAVSGGNGNGNGDGRSKKAKKQHEEPKGKEIAVVILDARKQPSRKGKAAVEYAEEDEHGGESSSSGWEDDDGDEEMEVGSQGRRSFSAEEENKGEKMNKNVSIKAGGKKAATGAAANKKKAAAAAGRAGGVLKAVKARGNLVGS